jgi:Ras-related protein Rab-6A
MPAASTDSSDRQVTSEEGEAKAREHGMLFIETSALANVNIKLLFKKACLSICLLVSV